MDIISAIASIPLFKGLTPKQCKSLGKIAARRNYSLGQSFFSEGDESIGFYIILYCKVKWALAGILYSPVKRKDRV